MESLSGVETNAQFRSCTDARCVLILRMKVSEIFSIISIGTGQ